MKIVSDINAFVYIVLTIFYCYQGIYVIIALLGKKKKKNYNTEAKTLHKYAFIIAARNENAVIGNLIDSIKNQNYPSELIDVIVVADNCTDNTAEISRQHGAIVYERFNNILIGKGYAMDYVFNKIKEEYDYFSVGSDQIWNSYLDFGYLTEFLSFARPEQRLTFSPSFGTDNIKQSKIENFRKGLSGFNNISVRESAGAKIVKE